MAKQILFVVEGERTETKLLISMLEKALNLSDKDYIISKYKANIHKLFKRMCKLQYDSFLTFLYSINKDIFPKDMFTPETAFTAVYLFFDLDPQDELFSIEETKEIANFFNDETVNGKLYISIPMVESVFDFESYDTKKYLKRTYPIKDLSKTYKYNARYNSFLAKKYKTISFSKIKPNDIYSICLLNMKKYCFLSNKEFDKSWKKPSSPIESINQQIPYLEKCEVSVLNTAILLIPDYSIDLLNKLKSNKKDGY